MRCCCTAVGAGVNTAAVHLCRTLVPATRMVVTASPGKVERVRAMGVHHVVDYTAEEFAPAVRGFTGGWGVDVVLDHIGAAYLKGNLKAMAPGGRLVVIGLMGGLKAELNLALLMVKRHTVIGSVLRSRPVPEKADIMAEFEKVVVPHFAARRIVPLIDSGLSAAGGGRSAPPDGSERPLRQAGAESAGGVARTTARRRSSGFWDRSGSP